MAYVGSQTAGGVYVSVRVLWRRIIFCISQHNDAARVTLAFLFCCSARRAAPALQHRAFLSQHILLCVLCIRARGGISGTGACGMHRLPAHAALFGVSLALLWTRSRLPLGGLVYHASSVSHNIHRADIGSDNSITLRL